MPNQPTQTPSSLETQYTQIRWLHPAKTRIPNLLRPRLTFEYLISVTAGLYITYCFLIWSPLFASNLPAVTGPFGVGTVDIEVASSGERRGPVSDVLFREGGEIAFQMETVLFSLFYPAQRTARSSSSKHLWISKPLAATAEGYLRFGHVNNLLTNSLTTLLLWVLVGGIRIPAQVDVPLLIDPAAEIASQRGGGQKDDFVIENPPYPVIVFSHGMASSRTDYTQYCSELASRGYIVAAIEHRDGSSPGSIITKQDGSTKPRWPISKDQLRKPSDENAIETETLKKLQLDFRQAEIGETISFLRALNKDEAESDLQSLNLRKEGKALAGFARRLDLDNVVMAGHSYGATGALQALQTGPSDAFPFSGGIALDPGKSSGPLNANMTVPILIVHSNSWSRSHSIFYGRPHFDVVKEIATGVAARGIPAWFMTSLGTSHPSVTDAPLIEPLLLSWTTGASIRVREGVREYFAVTAEFVKFLSDGRKRGVLDEAVTHPEYDVVDEERDRTLPPEMAKYWQVHVAPSK